ncbi:nucleoside triphosphate pyrophosphohydrolase [Micromonospora sp. C28SCA-DRY-2]|uniref:nucleoside triphosphate pyrophosphohydrolase n=1 Tax=Micromonospora sp. C28SCA-DRY-2 TaxID=3059522 RepID=UPI00267594B3|nr:nucleoside triphosphate pyrophosphohydrolase [Micromonospora sp. C28SCA-DRY-2]MDO3701168.1 nucleoside triphosphate pyrophosphohydrolase [Micromonospora sp. C28SCA-DRY-2]
MPRIVLLVTSPRLPAGLLTAAAWDVVRQAPVLAGAESQLTTAVRAAGAEVTVVESAATAALLDAAAAHGTAVWLAGPTGDEALARELGLRLAREPGLAELELMYGSWDPPGARLLDAVAVMDRLYSPGGDPWKRAQTHESLARFLLEECYEAYDAIGAGDTDALREELGDVLLQVVLHARLAEELPEGERWTVDDVAGGLVEKMVRRNPHVFAGAEAGTLEEITENWERIKRAEKPRGSVLDGVALSQPALALAAKILERAARVGLSVPPPLAESQVDPEARLGASLLATVAAAREAGIDPEAALRRTTLAYAQAIRATEPRTPDQSG